MRSTIVVAVEERTQGRSSVLVAHPGLHVGPLPRERAVVALDLAVGLGSVGPGPLVACAACHERCSEGSRTVAGAVVAQDPSDLADAVAAEELHRPRPERRRRGPSL